MARMCAWIHAPLLRELAPRTGLGAALEASPPPPSSPRPQPRYRVRAAWISDVHLGTPGCQAHAVLDFLRRVDCDTLYLVGDIIDGWQLRRTWYWPQAHNDVIQKILRKARKGTRVIYIPGNHDEFARTYLDHAFGGVELAEECLHTTADGRRLWVTHGDLYDGVIQCARWLALLGDSLYEFTLKLNRHLNSWRARAGLPYWSLSKYLKLKVKRAVSYVADFEQRWHVRRTSAAPRAWCAVISITPRSAPSMASCTATTGTGWKASQPSSNTPTADWTSCTGDR
jgi:UDP-2,3-diacylglucosamine pyrophosphatase LpxH